MVMQMVPMISNTEGEPTILFKLLPVLFISIILDFWEDSLRYKNDVTENNLKVHRISPKGSEIMSSHATWDSLQVGQVIKVKQNERFPADLILLKSSNFDGIAYVETYKLDGETNLKHKSSVRDMQDAILSETDASLINGHIYCD